MLYETRLKQKICKKMHIFFIKIQNNVMFTLLIRAIVVYTLVLIVFRLMGKRQLGQMQPFELVLTLIIADLATIPMVENSVPVLHGIVPLLTLVTMHYFLTLITRKSDLLNRVISGKPVIVINPNGIDYDAVQKLNISIDDLFEAIRGNGYFSIDEVQYAIVETNGTVNVLPKKDFSPVAISDLKGTKIEINGTKARTLLDEEKTTIPVTLVSEGKIMNNNVEIAKVSEDFINWVLKKTDTKKIKDVLILTLDGNGKIYFQTKKGKGIVLESPYFKEAA